MRIIVLETIFASRAMIKNMKVKIFLLLGFLGFFLSLFFTNPSLADANPSLDGLNRTVDSTGKLAVLKQTTDIDQSVAAIVGQILAYVGVAFLILMIYGGILWMFSQGDSKKLEKARDIILNAIIGMIIVFFAYAITSYIGSTLTTPSTPNP